MGVIAAVVSQRGDDVLADAREDRLGVAMGAWYDGDVELLPALDYFEFGDAV